jgi:hypothetical protein
MSCTEPSSIKASNLTYFDLERDRDLEREADLDFEPPRDFERLLR